MAAKYKPCSWYYMADCGHWHPFEGEPNNPIPSHVLEKYYLEHVPGSIVSASSHQSLFDFRAMLRIDTTTGKEQRIHRNYSAEKRCSCFSAVPVFWEKVDASRPYQLIPLNASTVEYLTVSNYVKSVGQLRKDIKSIYRIQNQDLLEFYCRKKRQLKRIHGLKEIQEKLLFHGTAKRNVASICKYNFDINRAGQSHGHLYGKGIYFAVKASEADKYTPIPNPQALPVSGGDTVRGLDCVMFLARVLVGQSTEGKSDFTQPDQPKENHSYDSCVDNILRPKMYVIFDSTQIYPEYLIRYV